MTSKSNEQLASAAKPQGEPMRCIVINDEPPGSQLRSIRRPVNGPFGWLVRQEWKFLQRFRPEIQLASHIRGNRVAVDYLLEALVRYSQRVQLTFVVPRSRKTTFESWVITNKLLKDRYPIEVCTLPEFFDAGLNTIAPELWLNVHGDQPFTFRMRDQLSSRVYPTVTVQHGLSLHSLLYDRFLRTMLTPTFACDSLVCTSQACKKAVANLLEYVSSSIMEQLQTAITFNGRLDVIPLCVDTERFRPQNKTALRRKLGIPDDSVFLLYLGYLSQVKADLTPLILMIHRLLKNNSGKKILFMIAGTGPEVYSNQLSEVIREIGLADAVTIARDISDDYKEKLLGAADIFLAPCDSMQESFGLTPVEAMACGLPQVVADWSGYRETVAEGETGFLIPTIWGCCDDDYRFTGELWGWKYDHVSLGQSIVLDLECMYNKLQLLIDRPDLLKRMSDRSRARAVSEFSYVSIARKYDELFNELSGIASRIETGPSMRRFDQPQYFSSFGHFATNELSDDWKVVRCHNKDYLSIAHLSRIVQAELPDTLLFDEPLLNKLVQLTSDNVLSYDSFTVGHLISLVSDDIRLRSKIRRHILFLIKHGRISVKSPSAVSIDPTEEIVVTCNHRI